MNNSSTFIKAETGLIYCEVNFQKMKKHLYFKNRDVQKISRDLSSGGLELFSRQKLAKLFVK